MSIIKFKESERVKLRDFQTHHAMNKIPLIELESGLGETEYLEHEGKVLGVATIAKNGFHPNYDHLYFAVVDQDPNVIQSLYDSLTSGRSAGLAALQIMYNEPDLASQSVFTKANGFNLTLTCNCPEIDVSASIAKLDTISLPIGLRILRYSQLTSTEKAALRAFRLNGYVETHFWSPPIDISDELWQRTDVSDEEEELSWCVFKGEKPVLCSDAHIDGDDIWLGWGWHDEAAERPEVLKQVWSMVLERQLTDCQRQGKRLFGEFDSLDRYAQFKSERLVHLTKDVKYIFQQRADSFD